MIFSFKSIGKLAIAFFPFLFIYLPSTKQDKRYVELKYAGEPSKPYPEITFYLPGSIDTVYDNFYIYKFEVTKNQLDSIELICEKSILHTTPDILSDLFLITIFRNEKKKSLVTRDKNGLKEMFDGISRQFKNCANEKSVKDALINLQRRLGIPVISNKHPSGTPVKRQTRNSIAWQ